jgi:hypothetical protein
LVLASNPLTWTNEIDIIETDPETPTTAYLTLHKNTSGDGGVPDQFREPHIIPTPFTLVGQWHTYGLLWTQAYLVYRQPRDHQCTAFPIHLAAGPADFDRIARRRQRRRFQRAATDESSSVGARMGEVKSEERKLL